MAQQITIEGVRKTYGAVTALSSIHLQIKAGEFMSLLGPSGSGKTTLLMIIAGFTRPDHGSIRFDDQEVVTMPAHKRDIGLVFQNYALFPHMTVAENIAFPLRYRSVPREEFRSRVDSALGLVQLGGFGARRIDQLSGGQKQRVALARAVVFNPKILIMDEPLSALDKNLRESMQIELRNLQRKLGTTTIYVTHDQQEALTMSDRIAVMSDSAIQQIGTPREIYASPANRFVAGFMGDSQFVGVHGIKGETAILGDTKLKLGRAPDFAGSDGLLLIRPEMLELLSGERSEEMNVLAGEAKDVVYQGDSVLIVVRLATGDDVFVRRRANEATRRAIPKPGNKVWVGIHPADTVVVRA
ncbi:MAG: ABC transporter ATP-binding protein [Parvibaculaceae bacterium]